MRLLELGCGTGGAALELANFANVSILGVDNDPNNVGAVTCEFGAHGLTTVPDPYGSFYGPEHSHDSTRSFLEWYVIIGAGLDYPS